MNEYKPIKEFKLKDYVEWLGDKKRLTPLQLDLAVIMLSDKPRYAKVIKNKYPELFI